MNHNIIGFGGRLASGKTELASICEQYGYTKLYFALPLKQLCADLLDVSIDELNRLKRNNQPIDITVNDDWVDIIHTETNIPYEAINSIINGKVIHTVRELLQVVGTDVIRQFNPNWHVERIREMIKPNNKYVIDDVRFPNEKNMIEEMNGVCWYVIRPIINNVSNHISETALDWRQFDNIIVNNKSLGFFKYHWEVFMSKGHDESLKLRQQLYQKMMGNNELVNEISHFEIEENSMFTLQDAFFINADEFNYSPKFIDNNNIDKIEEKENYVLVTYKDNSEEIVKNCFLIEDLKRYL